MDENGGRVPPQSVSGAGPDRLGGVSGGHGLQSGANGQADRLYGPDLVDMPKMGVAYYERIFADAEVESNTALVVDDSVRSLAWAHKAGAKVVLVTKDASLYGKDEGVVGSLAELPVYVDRFFAM